MRRLSFPCIALLLAPLAAAQTQLFVPALSQLDPMEANTFSNYPLMRQAGVWQSIVAQTEVGTSSMTWNGVAFRFDGPSFGNRGGTMQRFELWLGNKGVDPDKSLAVFGANHQGPLTKVVALSNWTFPADSSVNPDVYGATNGALAFKFSQPFVYTGGNLVLELRWSGNSNTGSGIENAVLDAEEAPWAGPAGGAVAYQGAGCHGATIAAQGMLAPGGQVSIAGTKLGRAAIHALGLPTQIKLDGLGAQGCVLWNDLLATSVSLADAAGSVAPFGATNTWPLPADTSLNGIVLHFQNLGVDPVANQLGVVTSDQAKVTLGSYRALTRKWFSHFHHLDANAPIASMSAPLVPMMRFN